MKTNDDAAHLAFRLTGNDSLWERLTLRIYFLPSMRDIVSSSNYSVQWFRLHETATLYLHSSQLIFRKALIANWKDLQYSHLATVWKKTILLQRVILIYPQIRRPYSSYRSSLFGESLDRCHCTFSIMYHDNRCTVYLMYVTSVNHIYTAQNNRLYLVM